MRLHPGEPAAMGWRVVPVEEVVKVPPVPVPGQARCVDLPAPPRSRARDLVECAAPRCGRDFLPVGDETHCGPCRGERAEAAQACEGMAPGAWAPLSAL
ncbi:hypothetical protein GCM10010329_19610 [Streptomyces spiroverticillatus]|uniref:Uncharacterized protein n=1 Tax=Streptomyces finlayi TaxID=67296 RepID=A0A919C8U5_9ACTN|nr:hypothetical protein GCM10010329_19610 [Streptomyces spiroverticillatus]GHC83192.1 hypothetical protein GCM10010334_12050 [Streptomyces finlayi]